jgi:hypothetical protein
LLIVHSIKEERKNISKELNKGRLEEEENKKGRKGKFVPVLKHYAMKTYGGVEV